MNTVLLTLRITLQDGVESNIFSGTGSVTLDGVPYTGVPIIQGVSGVDEDGETTAKRFRIGISGTSQEIRDAAMTDTLQGVRVFATLFILDSASAVLKKLPMFDGFVSHATITDSYGDTEATIEYEVVTHLTNHRGISGQLYSPETQRDIDPTDTAMDSLPLIATREISWK